MVEVELSKKNVVSIIVVLGIFIVLCIFGLISTLVYSPFSDPENTLDVTGTVQTITLTNNDLQFDIELDEYPDNTFRITNLFVEEFSYEEAKEEITSGTIVYLKVIKTHYEKNSKIINIRELRTDQKTYLDEARYLEKNISNTNTAKEVFIIMIAILSVAFISVFIYLKKKRKTLLVEPQDLFINFVRPNETYRQYRKRIVNRKYVFLVLAYIIVILLAIVSFCIAAGVISNLALMIVSGVAFIASTVYIFIARRKILKEDINKYSELYQFQINPSPSLKYGDESNYLLFTEDGIEEFSLEFVTSEEITSPLGEPKIISKLYPYADLNFEFKTKYCRNNEIVIVFLFITGKTDEDVKTLLFLDENLYSVIKKFNIDVPHLDGYLKNIKENITINLKRIRFFYIKQVANLPFTYVKNKLEKVD